MNLASWPPISTMERLRAPGGGAPARGRPAVGVGGAQHGGHGVAAGAGDADGSDVEARGRATVRDASEARPCCATRGHYLRRSFEKLGDERLRRFHGIALRAAVDVGHRVPGPRVEQDGLGPGGAEVEPEDDAGAHGPFCRLADGPGAGGPAMCGGSVVALRRAAVVKADNGAGAPGGRRQRADAARRPVDEALAVRGPVGKPLVEAHRPEAQNAERLEVAGLGGHDDRHAGQPREGLDHRGDESSVAHHDHWSVDLGPVVERVHVARHALEDTAEDAPVVLTLVGVVGELALGEHGASAGDGDAVRAGLRQLHGLFQRAAQPGAQAFDRLAGAGRAALVGLVAHAPGGVARED
jgi:hypothetical protein